MGSCTETLDCSHPGTTKLERLDENIDATTLKLTPEDVQDLDGTLANIPVVGDRYPAEVQCMTNR